MGKFERKLEVNLCRREILKEFSAGGSKGKEIFQRIATRQILAKENF